MIYTQNLHTHTVFCDGKNTPEQLVQKAIELGFDTLGFSGHSPVPIDLDYFMQESQIEEYKSQVKSLADKYSDKIRILCGIEYDMFSNTSQQGYDYIIGSNHHLMIDGILTDIDQKADVMKSIIDEHFNGCFDSYAEAYFETTSHIPEKVNADFIAHIDLISKNCELTDIFDFSSPRYKAAALEAIHTLCKKINIFEVNTGAISRGYRKTPYPADFILKEINNIGGHVIITSDCHNKDFLNHKYDFCIDYIKSCGFKEVYHLSEYGFKGICIK